LPFSILERIELSATPHGQLIATCEGGTFSILERIELSATHEKYEK